MGRSLEELWDEGAFEEVVVAARKQGDRLLEGMALFHLWRFDESEVALAACQPQQVDEDEDEDVGVGVGVDVDEQAELEWYRGLLLEFRGGNPAPHFMRAARLAPDRFQEPVRLTDALVDEVIEEALAQLPPVIVNALADAVVSVAPFPAPHPDVDPLVLGLYTGSDHLSRSIEEGVRMPAQVEVYRRNIERIAADRTEAIEELRITLLHELAHHLGFDEEEMERLGLD